MSDSIAASVAAVNDTSTPTIDGHALWERGIANLPAELRAGQRHAVWWPTPTSRDRGKLTKPPRRADDPTRYADPTDPATWSTFDDALAVVRRGDASGPGGRGGVGRMLSDDDNLVVIDIDHCRDPQTAIVELWALDFVHEFKSYTEVSPSGRGLHIWLRGSLPVAGRKKGNIEVYAANRFISLTGDRLPGTPATIEDRTAKLAEWYPRVFGAAEPTRERPPCTPCTEEERGGARGPLTAEDEALIARASACPVTGEEFRRLWAGDRMRHDSDSERDMRLCNFLAYRTNGDAARMERLFRVSGCMRDKWERQDYRTDTIAEAIDGWRRRQNAAPRATPDTRERYRFLSLDEMMALPSPRWIVKGILHERSRGMLFGKSNVGKTFIMLDMSFCISTGRPWMEHAVRRKRVCYIFAEGTGGASTRIKAWCQANPEAVREADIFFLPAPVMLNDRQCIDQFKRDLAEYDARHRDAGSPELGLIVIDTLAESSGSADENAKKEMQPILDAIKEIRDATGAAVVTLHHPTKADARSLRGSGAIEGALDVVLRAEADDKSGVITISVAKQREGPKDAVMHVRLEPVVVGVDDDGDEITSCVVVPADADTNAAAGLTPTAKKMLVMLTEHPEGLSATNWLKRSGLADATFMHGLKELRKVRLAVKGKGKRGHWFPVTPVDAVENSNVQPMAA